MRKLTEPAVMASDHNNIHNKFRHLTSGGHSSAWSLQCAVQCSNSLELHWSLWHQLSALGRQPQILIIQSPFSWVDASVVCYSFTSESSTPLPEDRPCCETRSCIKTSVRFDLGAHGRRRQRNVEKVNMFCMCAGITHIIIAIHTHGGMSNSFGILRTLRNQKNKKTCLRF